MRPHFAGIIHFFATSCESTNRPVRLTFTSLSQASSGCSSAGEPQVAPALFTRMSTRPHCSTRGGMASRLPMSQTNALAETPRCFLASSSSSFFLAVIATFAPISINASAICSPRPRDPPVTSALRPDKSKSFFTPMRGYYSHNDYARHVLGRHGFDRHAHQAAHAVRGRAVQRPPRASHPHGEPGRPRRRRAAGGGGDPRLVPPPLPALSLFGIRARFRLAGSDPHRLSLHRLRRLPGGDRHTGLQPHRRRLAVA